MTTTEKAALVTMNVAGLSSLVQQNRSELLGMLQLVKCSNWVPDEELSDEELDGIVERLETGTKMVQGFLDKYFSEPLRKLRSGARLTEQEYYLLRGLDVIPDYATLSGVTTEGEYQVYKLLYYRDGACSGVIMTAVYEASRCTTDGPEPEFAPVRPEQVRRRCLTPRQQAFFRTHFPEDYIRMQP